ncbi:MAG: 4Fe-4S binding protein [Acidobacteria bacterium]|nr:4Fe-4S binding protein [Acidobacteriota bacterium]
MSTTAVRRLKQKLIRRAGPDRSQQLRQAVQLLFLALNVWIGVQFYLFVRYYESGGSSLYASRPPGVEGWLPIASLMNLKVFVFTGKIAQVHPAGMFLLLAFVGISLLLRKAFCGWLCPVGTISEWLWKLGRNTFRRNWLVPRWADIALRSLKYILLGLFLLAVFTMSVGGIETFLGGPYGLIDDVKMLNFFRTLGITGGLVLALMVILSVFIQNFWCRYLCPYGALMGLTAKFSPARIRRDPEPCIDCGKCAKACPSRLAVDQLISITSVECIGCLECVAVCPSDGALQMSLPRGKKLPAWAMAAGIAVVFLGITGYARMAGYWHTEMPSDVYMRLIPHADEFTHP